MPLYDYKCSHCGTFEVLTTSQNSAPILCPDCHGPTTRIMSAPRLQRLNPAQRKAHETNERSAHEPRMSKGHSCCSGGTCHHHAATADPERPRLKTQTGPRRPWMISH